MTDQELIKALREDAPRIGWLGWGRLNDVGKKMADAADRLEALLAENEALNERDKAHKELKQALERKCAALEATVRRLEVERDHFRDLTKKLWCEKRYCKDTGVDASKVESFRCTGEKCPLELGNIRRCTMRNCPWRTTPSTEVSPTGQKG